MIILKIFTIVGALLLVSTPSLASNYTDFQRDLAVPYGHYRQSLMLTSKKENADQAKLAIEQFIKEWETLSKRYSADIPAPFVAIADFSNKLHRPVAIGHEALILVNEGQVSNAHAVLEEVRYLLWGMRIQARLNSVADKANDFHEAMEVVMDQAAAAHSAEELSAISQRYGAWLMIKWEEHALADDMTSIRAKFDPALAEGRPVINAYLDALRAGDSVASKKLISSVKNAYKKIWLLDPK
jgi:hypothetical protein